MALKPLQVRVQCDVKVENHQTRPRRLNSLLFDLHFYHASLTERAGKILAHQCRMEPSKTSKNNTPTENKHKIHEAQKRRSDTMAVSFPQHDR